MDFSTVVSSLSGIGKKRYESFLNLGVNTVEDLLYHFPRAYQNRGEILPLAMTPDGTVGAFLLTVATKPQTVMLKNRKQLTKFVARLRLFSSISLLLKIFLTWVMSLDFMANCRSEQGREKCHLPYMSL